MKRELKAALVVMTVMVALGGLLLAQQPAGPAQRERTTSTGGLRDRMPVSSGLDFLVGLDGHEVAIENTEQGVNLVVTAEPDHVERVQSQVKSGISRLEWIRERAAEHEPPLPEERPPGVLGLTIDGKLRAATHETQDGVVVSFTAEEPGVVEVLHEKMPAWVADARERAEERRRRELQMREAKRTLLSLVMERAWVKTEPTADGVVVHIHSDDPQVAEQLKQGVPAGIEMVVSFGRRMARRTGIGTPSAEQAPGPPRAETELQQTESPSD